MPSDLETSLETLITLFHKYAGDDDTLSKKEFKMLMQNELSSFLKCQRDPAAVDRIMKDLDGNGDGKLDFSEFVGLAAGLAIACNQCYEMKMKNRGQCKKK